MGRGKMGESKKMWYIGLWAICLVLMLSAVLQVCYRTQRKMRNRVRNEIVQVQQDINAAETDLSSYERSEILGNLVISVYPESEIIGYHKMISVQDLPTRKEKVQ